MPPIRLAAACLAVLVLGACGVAAGRRAVSVPPRVRLGVDLPRREAEAVNERWALYRGEKGTFVVHGVDVERRRTVQTCGKLAEESFAAGWEDLAATGVLRPGEDLRLVPPRGAEPFAGRLEASYGGETNQVASRRPLTEREARAVTEVLRRWEARLQPVSMEAIPAELRVELARGGCSPPGRAPR
jgi:hypothetical protein